MKLPSYEKASSFEGVTNYLEYNCDGVSLPFKTYYIETYGCQMNERDTESVKGILESFGMSEAKTMEEADLIGINSCSIRENAHNKVFGMLGNIKSTYKDKFVMLFGCMAQEEGVVERLMKKNKEVDLIFGTHNIHELPELLQEAINKRVVNVESIRGNVVEGIPVKRTSPVKAYINIIYGCNKFCTYCIVPFTRGRERSRTKESIIKEAKELYKLGYQEICLLGQNVNAYGKDLNTSLKELLEELDKIGIPRITFMTSHPWDFTDELIEMIGKSKHIMPFIHLPVQSGSTNVLKRMNRRYTKDEYLKLVNKLRESIKDIRITTDIIVGFPGETEDDFEDTLNLVKEVKFDGAFTFIYSPRENTKASTYEDQVGEEVAKERLYRLNELINDLSNSSNKKLLNKEVDVLIDKLGDNNNIYLGTTNDGRLITLDSDEDILNKLVTVKVVDTKSWSIKGKHLHK